MSVLAILAAASAAPIEAAWNLDEGSEHRWVVETEVRFPGHAFVFADRNLDVRAHTLGVQASIDCDVTDRRTRSATLDCTIEEAALSGSTFPGQYGRLAPVLEEMDAKLTGAPLQLTVSNDGRIRDVDFEALAVSSFENRRTRRTDAFLRMMVVQALAPLDLAVPKSGFPTEHGWEDGSRLLLGTPVTTGSAGNGRIQHTAEKYDADRVLVSSTGKAVLVPGGFLDSGGLALDAEIEGFTVFDVETGRVTEAAWSTVATPTATSGPLARDYSSVSRVRSLEPGENARIAPTFEWRPTGS